MPDLDFPVSRKYSPYAVAGKWYCPYFFVKEGNQLIKEQMRMCIFYEMTPLQFWGEVYTCEIYDGEGRVVEVDVSVKREAAVLNGSDVANDNFEMVDGVIWFMLKFIRLGIEFADLGEDEMGGRKRRLGWQREG